MENLHIIWAASLQDMIQLLAYTQKYNLCGQLCFPFPQHTNHPSFSCKLPSKSLYLKGAIKGTAPQKEENPFIAT